jgi:putative spermidine/putrescine transport system substrate-binding protein
VTAPWRAPVALAVCALAVGAAGCLHDDGDSGGRGAVGTAPPERLPDAEGRLDLVALAGLVEDGSSDPAVDWVSGFEERTGCRVRVRLADTPDAMLRLLRTGDYDGVSAPGDAALLLVDSGQVAPVDTDLIPSYEDVYEGLRDPPHTTLDGRRYGVAQGRAANILLWRSDLVRPAPDSWSPVWEADTPYAGRIAAYDGPLAIADAALYLRATRPELGIEDVYELDDRQFEAALALLRRQRELLRLDWSDYTQLQAAVSTGDVVIGTAWQLVADLLAADSVAVDTTLPKEGATGWSDAWMIAAAARHPGCMYRWLQHMLSPRVNARVAEWYGIAPANRRACALTADRSHCARHHADDEAYYDRVELWRTPRRDCGDGRGAVCKDHEDWARGWDEVDD